MTIRYPSSASSNGSSSVPKGNVVGGEVTEVAVGVVPGGEAGQVAVAAAHHLDVQAAFGLVAERQVKVGDARDVVEVKVHSSYFGETIVTCCVSLFVMLSIPQIEG